MSNRALSHKHALPQNPIWIEFERTDGDQTQWPPNTTRIVDREGHVNYMRVASIDEPLSLKWRVEVGKALASLLNKPGRLQGSHLSQTVGLLTTSLEFYHKNNSINRRARLCVESMATRISDV